MRVLEVLDRECAAEGEDHRVPEHAEHEQVPVRRTELPGLAQRKTLRDVDRRAPGAGVMIRPPVDRAGGERCRREKCRDLERRLPARGIGAGEPGRRHVDGECATPPERHAESDREREMAVRKITDDRADSRDVERLCADAEEQAAGSHARECGRVSRQQGAGEADRGGPGEHARGAEAVDQHPADEQAGRCSAGCRSHSAGRSACW